MIFDTLGIIVEAGASLAPFALICLVVTALLKGKQRQIEEQKKTTEEIRSLREQLKNQ